VFIDAKLKQLLRLDSMQFAKIPRLGVDGFVPGHIIRGDEAAFAGEKASKNNLK
jgi:hypothetical protein